MKFVVLNGSPKGMKSITMQYVGLLQKKFTEHEFTILHIAQQIAAIERTEGLFESMIDKIKEADGVLWAFPLYVFLVPAQYKRFIELIYERGAETAFKDKYTAILATSTNFFDNLAVEYINGICNDLEMKYVTYYSADMYALLIKRKQEELVAFMHHFVAAITAQEKTFLRYKKITGTTPLYLPNPAFAFTKIENGDKKVLILTDSTSENANLRAMRDRFMSFFNVTPEVIDLSSIDIKGGCLGCLKCGYAYKCAYGNKDGFMDFYAKRVCSADVIIMTGTMKDRYLSAKWKQFFDRSFFNTHTPTLNGKQIGFIISGNLRENYNLATVLQAYTEWQKINLVATVTDEDTALVDDGLYQLAEKSVAYSRESFSKPLTFLGVGGFKVLRDDIWGRLRFPFPADHRHYKKVKSYDFPHAKWGYRITNFFLLILCKIPFIRKKIYTELNDLMLMPFRSVK